MKLILVAAAGGALGAAGRYLVGVGAVSLLGFGFPWGTLFVNIVGCFAMGALIESLALKFAVSLELRTFLVTGVLGGFTTFSAFALEFSTLLARKDIALGWIYLSGSVFFSIAALYAGLHLVRTLLQ